MSKGTDTQKNIPDGMDLYTEKYAEENDTEYGRCGTCKNYSRCNICSECEDGSGYEFDLTYYKKEHYVEIINWMKEDRQRG